MLTTPHYRDMVRSPAELPPLPGGQYDLVLINGHMEFDCTFTPHHGRGFILPDQRQYIVESDVYFYLLRQLPTP